MNTDDEQFDKLLNNKQALDWLKAVNKACFSINHQLSSVGLAAYEHSSELNNWKMNKNPATPEQIKQVFTQWNNWLKEYVHLTNTPFFKSVKDLNDIDQLYRNIDNDINNGRLSTIADCAEQIYQSTLSALGFYKGQSSPNSITRLVKEKPKKLEFSVDDIHPDELDEDFNRGNVNNRLLKPMIKTSNRFYELEQILNRII